MGTQDGGQLIAGNPSLTKPHPIEAIVR